MVARPCGLSLLFFISNVLAAYNPNRPYTIENFLPADANPAHRITCFGDRPEMVLPAYPDWNPNEHTVQQLCAKPQYGGLDAYKHLGGYCAVSADSTFPNPGRGLVAFDKSMAARTSTSLFNPELLLYCRTRCFCTSELVNRAPPDQDVDWDQAAFGPSRLGREDRTYQIKMEEVQVWGTMESHRGRTSHRVPRTTIWVIRETVARRYVLPLIEQVSIAPGNDPICQGPLPQYPLPGSFSGSDFGSLQSLCAVYLAGGDLSANAGMYCHRREKGTFGLDEPSRFLWFSDAMTPRLDWTLNNLFASLSIRYYCNVFCRCPDPLDSTTSIENTLLDIGEWDTADKDLRLKYGFTVVGGETPGSLDIIGANGISATIFPTQRPGQPMISATCGADGRQLCPFEWREDLYGPNPLRPLIPEYIGHPQPIPIRKLYQCGGDDPCQGPADCGVDQDIPGSSRHCSCVVPWTPAQLAAARARGEDAVAPNSICAVISMTILGSLTAKLNALNYGYGRLSPRSVDGNGLRRRDGAGARAEGEGEGEGAEGNGLEFEYPCVCNTSYISHACCDGSKNGLVWEDASLKLGVLKLPDEV